MGADKPALENELQPQLKVSAIEGSARQTEEAIVETVVCATSGGCEQEVCVVEDIERGGFELKTEALRELEGLAQRHICIPLPWASEGVATQGSNASQARGRQSWKSRCRVIERCRSGVEAGRAADAGPAIFPCRATL